MCIWLLSIGTMLSAFWILTASAFMQSPVGYEMATDGRAQMNDFLAIIQNPQLWVQFRIQLAAIATGAFFIAGVSAWKITKGQETVVFKNLSEFLSLLEQLQRRLYYSSVMHKRNN